MVTAETLRLAALATQSELQRLCRLTEEGAVALASAEQRASRAEAALKRSQQRLAQLKTAPDDLVRTARALSGRLARMTTAEFACGGEKAEREALRAVLDAIEGVESDG